MLVGYKLIDETNTVINQWGGVWGLCPDIPNPIMLPNGDHVHAPSLNVPYSGYMLIEWIMDEPPVPASISPRQVRLLLLQQNMLANVESMIAQQDQATQITWQYATVFLRSDPLLNQLAANLGLTDAEIDQFFREASQL